MCDRQGMRDVSRNPLYFDLLDACKQPSCPVCHLSLERVRRYLDGILHEYVNDPGVRSDLRRSFGYCNQHAWWLTESLGDVLGVAIIQRDVVNVLCEELHGVTLGRLKARDLVQRLTPPAECPACVQRRSVEDMAIGTLLQNIGDDRLASAMAGGLCLTHFRRALGLIEDAETLDSVVALQRRAWTGLREELAEFIRRQDYRFANESPGGERDSVWRSIGIVSGERGLR